MDENLEEARRKLREGKRRLANARGNPSEIQLSLLSIHSALDEYLRPPRTNSYARSMKKDGRNREQNKKPLGDVLLQLQRDRVINEAERHHVLWMRRQRNNVAHADPLYLTERYVERYASLVTVIINREVERRSIGRNQRNYDQPRPQGNRQRPTAPQSPKQERVPPRTDITPSEERPLPVPPTVPTEAPAESPTPQQPEAARIYDDFLSSLLLQADDLEGMKVNEVNQQEESAAILKIEQEFNDNDLLRKLLSQ